MLLNNDGSSDQGHAKWKHPKWLAKGLVFRQFYLCTMTRHMLPLQV